MTPKQLSNVLIKVLGLSICVHAVPGVITMAPLILVPRLAQMPGGTAAGTVGLLVSFGVEVAIGMALILYSQGLTNMLLKADDL